MGGFRPYGVFFAVFLLLAAEAAMAGASHRQPDHTRADGGTTDVAETDAGARAPAQSESKIEFPKERIPQISLSVSPAEVGVGEVIYWRLSVVRHRDVRVRLGTEASFGGLEVRAKEVSAAEVAGDAVSGESLTEVMEVQLIGFEPGEYRIPGQAITAVDGQGQIAELETDPATVTLVSLIANEPEPELKEDVGPGEKAYVKDYLLLWILGVLVAIACVVGTTLLVRWLLGKRSSIPDVFVPPPRPAEEIVLEKLSLLRGSSLLDEGKLKLFHLRLSEAVREYLGNRYLFDSLELSSEELSAKLKTTMISPEDFVAVEAFLETTDLVKFAKAMLSGEASLDLLDQSVALVEKTTPRREADGEGAGVKAGEHHA